MNKSSTSIPLQNLTLLMLPYYAVSTNASVWRLINFFNGMEFCDRI
jgi:hypothetical protein